MVVQQLDLCFVITNNLSEACQHQDICLLANTSYENIENMYAHFGQLRIAYGHKEEVQKKQ